MTREEAVETCAKAMMRRRGYNEQQWREQSKLADLAQDIVVALEALELLKPTTN
jgi:hypothetical protein